MNGHWWGGNPHAPEPPGHFPEDEQPEVKVCADCGEPLDRWGICPFADPERARVERAPVNCGHTVQENTRALRLALDLPQQTVTLSDLQAANPQWSGVVRLGWDVEVGGAR